MNKIQFIFLFLLLCFLSVSRWTLYSLCFVCVNFNYSWLENASSINTVEPVFDKVSITPNMRKFLSCFFNIRQFFSEFVLSFTNLFSISNFSCFCLILPFLLILCLLLNFFFNLFFFFFKLFCNFFMTVDFMK